MNGTGGVAIVGGGVTGLTAAHRLRALGVPVTLYEASGRVGGVIQSLRRDGYLAEFGPNTILETSPIIRGLVDDLGLERLYSDPAADRRYLVRYRRPIAMPGSPLGFLRTPMFSMRAKMRLAREPFIAPSPADQEENLADFVVRRLGREFLDYAINPFVGGVYAGDPARLSVRHAFPKLHVVEQKYGSLIKGQFLGARERKKRKEVSKANAPKFSFAEGLQDLTDGMRVKLGEAVRLNAPVRALKRSGAVWQIGAGDADGERWEEHAAVLLTSPAHKLAGIRLETEKSLSLEMLGEIHYPPVVSLVLGFRREDVAHPLDGFGMLIPEVEGFRILGTLFSSSLFPGRAPEGHVTLTSYIGGVRNSELALRDPEELVSMTLEDLKVLLGVRGKPTFSHQMLYPKAIPQYEVGYGRFKDFMNSLEREAPGLFLAGHYRDGISLGDSIVSGHNVAERIDRYMKGKESDGGPAASGGSSKNLVA